MKSEVQKYINTVLSKVAILDEPNVAFEKVSILEFNTHFDNGTHFKHQNGEEYALAILNAITTESYLKVSRFLKKEPNLSVRNIEDELQKHYLKFYVKGSSKEYFTWEAGDIGTAFLQIDDENKTITPHFINETAKERS